MDIDHINYRARMKSQRQNLYYRISMEHAVGIQKSSTTYLTKCFASRGMLVKQVVGGGIWGDRGPYFRHAIT